MVADSTSVVHDMLMNCKELIERTVTQLTGKPAQVDVHEDEFGAVFEIFSTNNALLIGKKRATIDALRVLSKALGYNGKHRIKVVLREREKEA
jgi:predicted RNA-binding protein Jag